MLFSLLALVVTSVGLATVAGQRDSTAMRDAAVTQYRSLTGQGGYDITRAGTWGECAAAQMTDGRTAVLVRTDGAWRVVRHSTYTDGYDLDSIDGADECNHIASRPQAPSYP